MIVDQHEVRVYSGSTELKALQDAGTITVDSNWTPHVQGRITVRAPADLEDTLPGTVLTIDLMQRFQGFAFVADMDTYFTGATLGAADTHLTGYSTLGDLDALLTDSEWLSPPRAATGRTFELIVTDRTRTHDEHTLSLASVEHRWVDSLYFNTDGSNESVPYVPSGATTIGVARDLLETAVIPRLQVTGGAVTVIDEATLADIPFTDQRPLNAGESVWDYISSYTTNARQSIYSPGDMTLRLIDTDAVLAGSLTVEHAENLIEWEETRQESTTVIVRYQGSGADPDARPMWLQGDGSTGIPSATELFDIDTPFVTYPPPGVILPAGANPASPYMTYANRDLRSIRLETINDYSVQPRDEVTYILPDESPVSARIRSISWQLGGRSEMTVVAS